MTDDEAIQQAVNNFSTLPGEEFAKLKDLNVKIKNHKGKWGVTKGGEKTPSGATVMYWVESDPLIQEFTAFMYDNSLLPIFNWTEWDVGSELFTSEDPNKYDNVDIETALKIIYAAIRKERFSDGILSWAFESGSFPKVINRLVALGTT